MYIKLVEATKLCDRALTFASAVRAIQLRELNHSRPQVSIGDAKAETGLMTIDHWLSGVWWVQESIGLFPKSDFLNQLVVPVSCFFWLSTNCAWVNAYFNKFAFWNHPFFSDKGSDTTVWICCFPSPSQKTTSNYIYK